MVYLDTALFSAHSSFLHKEPEYVKIYKGWGFNLALFFVHESIAETGTD